MRGNKNTLKEFNDNIKDAYLQSFCLKAQFVELTLVNDYYEEIKIFIDCVISCENPLIEEAVVKFKDVDSDAYYVVYFVYFNQKKIVECEFMVDSKVRFLFSSNDALFFNLDLDDSDFSVTLKKKKYLNYCNYISYDFNKYGISCEDLNTC